jgi:hypothetical protein
VQERTVKTFATPEGCKLVVENVKGQIVVEGWDRPETEITAVRHQEWAEVEIIQDDDKVIARTKNARGDGEQGIGQLLNWFSSDRTPTVDYSVRVPFASNVKLKNVNGPIEVRQTQGKVRVNNVDGSATLEEIEGDVRAETVNGALRIVQFSGAADLKTVNGQVDLEKGNLAKLSAQTVNGNVTVAAELSGAKYSFKTVNGNCKLHIPADLRASVSAHGVNLHVDCAQPAQSVRRQFGNWQGAIGPEQSSEPKVEITFHTVNGHLDVDNTGPAAGPAKEPTAAFVTKAEAAPEPSEAPQAPEPPTPPDSIEVKVDEAVPAADETPEPQPPSQLEVLQMIERGEITVEEAVKHLKS